MSLVPSKSFRENDELVADLARFAEGVCSEQAVRKKYHFSEEAWVAIAEDELLVEMIEAEKVRRIRNGAAKREKAQLHVVAAPDVLNGIMRDPKANARHRIDASKALDDLAGFAPQRPGVEQDRVVVRIDLSADTKDPRDVLTFEASVRPDPNPNDAKIIDGRTPMIEADNQLNQQEAIPPVKRGPGRPKGSRNKPKIIDEHERPQGLPGFDVG